MIKNKLVNIITILILIIKTQNIGYAQDFEVSPGIIEFNAEPGETKSAIITVINHANTEQEFRFDLYDFKFDKHGALIMMDNGSTEYSLGNQIDINPQHLLLQPNEAKQVVLTVHIPADEFLTRWGALAIKSLNEQTALVADKSVGMVLSGQVIIQIYQSPKSNTKNIVKITGLTEITTEQDSIRRFRALVANIGEKVAHCNVFLYANNLETTEETILQKVNFKVLPGGERIIELSMKKDALPPGKYVLASILEYGTQYNLEGDQIEITVDTP